MQLEQLNLPDGWEEHTNYSEKMSGVIAAYKTKDTKTGMRFIEVVLYAPEEEHLAKVELRKQVSAEPRTVVDESVDVDSHEEAEREVVRLAESCK